MPIRRFSGARVKPALEMRFARQGDFTFVHRFETGNGPQGGGLAAARRAQQATDVAGIQMQVEVLHDPLVLIAAGEVAQVKQ